MAKGSSFNPLQLVSPAMLVFCFILFFLPWVELSCVPPQDLIKGLPREAIESANKKAGTDITKPIGVFNQSGLQIATGELSLASDAKKMEEDKGEKASKKLLKEQPSKEELGGAPLLFLFPVALLAGIGFGVAPWPSPTRRFIAAGCCLLALAVIGVQIIIGFPLETKLLAKIKEKEKDAGGMMGGMRGMIGGGGLGAGGGEAKAKGKDAKEPELFKVRWKFPLYLTLLLLLGAAGAALLPGGAPPNKKRRYDDDDDYDDDEDDYDPPPRRKRRYDEEDEDRPRKKRRYDDDEDEDDRPRKKKRYDDEDEDDRPRKKSKPVAEDLPDDDEPPPPPKAKKASSPPFAMPPAAPPASPPAPPPQPAGGNPFAFDDEPAPKKKPKRRDDDDDDDEDDRPRKRR